MRGLQSQYRHRGTILGATLLFLSLISLMPVCESTRWLGSSYRPNRPWGLLKRPALQCVSSLWPVLKLDRRAGLRCATVPWANYRAKLLNHPKLKVSLSMFHLPSPNDSDRGGWCQPWEQKVSMTRTIRMTIQRTLSLSSTRPMR